MSFSLKTKQDIMTNCKNNDFDHIKEAFLKFGSITDPNKAYHLEFAFKDELLSLDLSQKLKNVGFNFKSIDRKDYKVLYIKEADEIALFLNIVGAHKTLLEFENIRIVKEVSNTINRQVNCETANLSKTVDASIKQVDTINLIMQNNPTLLSPQLRIIAELRLKNPNASLSELGDMCSPKLSKSCVNHRFRKIMEISKQL